MELENHELFCCIDEAVAALLADIRSELSDIASGFYALDVARMKSHSVSELDRVLGSNNLRLQDENWLLDNLLVLSEDGDAYSSLLRYVIDV